MHPLVPRSIGVVGVSLLLTVAGLAAAQTASVTVTPQSESVSLTGGQSTEVSVDVTLRLDQFTCLEETDFPVQMSAAGARGVAGSPAASNLTYTVGAGIYDSRTSAGAYNETQSVAVTIQAPSGTANAFSADLTVTGLFPGGNFGANQDDPTSSGGCGPGEFPQAEGSRAITVNVQPDVTTSGPGSDGGTGGNTTDGGTGGNTTDGGDENGSPMGAWLVPAGLVGAALIAARRRG